ncbi:MAG: response regulator [Myxococcota bacterium]
MAAGAIQRVVVADDSKLWIEKIVPAMERSGCEVITASNGEAVIDLCMDRKRPVDLVIVDLVMPGIDGFEVARFLRSDRVTRDIPIIGFTDLFRHADYPDGPKAKGFDVVLEKSSSVDQFLFIFNKYLDGYRPVTGKPPAPRVPSHIPAEWSRPDGAPQRGVVANVSATGAFLSTASPVEAGGELYLSFPLPDGPTIRTRARVVWRNEHKPGSTAHYSRGMGVVFREVRPAHRSALENFVKAELARY